MRHAAPDMDEPHSSAPLYLQGRPHKLHCGVLLNLVHVRAQDEEVVGGLDGRKARARDLNGTCAGGGEGRGDSTGSKGQ